MAFKLRILQILCVSGLLMVLLGIVGIFVIPQHANSVKATLGMGFAFVIICSIWLAKLRCPACSKRFFGPMTDEEFITQRGVFGSKCLNCGWDVNGHDSK